MIGATEMLVYLTRLLPVYFNEVDLQLIFSNGLPVFFIRPAAMRHVQPLVLDYKLRDCGPVVPQSISTSATLGHPMRYNDVSLKMPIFFVHADRKSLGLGLKQAVMGNLAGLLNAPKDSSKSNSDLGYLSSYSRTASICVRVSVSQVAHHGAIV